jgi:ParB family transcriptional regulator, chromosome partitioning protein
MNSRKALGKGIMALMPATEDLPRELRHQGVLEIDLHQIRPNPYQPRIEFNSDALADLRESIREKGVISPVIVRRVTDGYELIAGERRFRAAREMGLKKIPAVVKEVKNDSEMLELSLIENIQREQLNPIEEARAYRSLMKEYNYTQEQLSGKVGKNRTTITNALRLLNLPPAVQDLLFQNKLSMGHARALLGLKQTHKQEALALKTVNEGLSVRTVERLVKEAESKKNGGPLKKKETARGRYGAFEEELRHKFGTKVTITERGSKGKIEIEFYSAEDMERILEIMV